MGKLTPAWLEPLRLPKWQVRKFPWTTEESFIFLHLLYPYTSAAFPVHFSMSYGRQDFLSQPAPENYVAGLGRGATGFTTRSDLGPAREGPTPEQIQEALAKRAQQLGAPTPTAYNTSREKGGKGKEQEAEAEEDDERFQDPDNEVGLFAYGAYDREDDEADLIYQEVDEKMDRRRRARRLVFSPLPSINACGWWPCPQKTQATVFHPSNMC